MIDCSSSNGQYLGPEPMGQQVFGWLRGARIALSLLAPAPCYRGLNGCNADISVVVRSSGIPHCSSAGCVGKL